LNGKRCIGYTKHFFVRYGTHKSELNNNRHQNSILQNSYNKYNGNFKFELVNLCNIEDLQEMEIYFIKAFDTQDRRYGYNIQSGGNKVTMSEETKAKISKSMKQKIKNGNFFNKEHRRKLSIANIGNKHGYGCHEPQPQSCKKIKQFSKEGTFIKTYNSIKEAASFNKLNAANICHACKGDSKTAYNYRWSYV